MIDSLGTWLTATLDRFEPWSQPSAAWSDAFDDQLADLVDAWRSCRHGSRGNQRGWLGLVSEHRSGRIFADLLGIVNQAMAGPAMR